jgi:hypothetical protein
VRAVGAEKPVKVHASGLEEEEAQMASEKFVP